MGKLWKARYDSPIVVDIETVDHDLKKIGAGVYSRHPDNRILCVGVMDCRTGEKRAIRADDREALSAWLSNDREKLLANAIYDLDWLENFAGIPVNGFIHDVQVAEPLLDVFRPSYALDRLAEYYGVPGKKNAVVEPLARRICEEQGIKYTDYRKVLGLMPYDVVADYCIGDLEATYNVWRKQILLLRERSLVDLYECECDLVRLFLVMRKNGMKVDLDTLERARDIAIEAEANERAWLFDRYGEFNINASASLAQVLRRAGITDFDRSEKTGKDCVNAKFYARHRDNETVRHIVNLKKINKRRRDFLDAIRDTFVMPDGRVHCSFHALRKDAGGTITGRMACATPNLQQVPRKDPVLGTLCRDIYVPDDGCWYGHTDYGQIEYRVFAHYARGWTDNDWLSRKAEDLREEYNRNPLMDYHAHAGELIRQITGQELERSKIKGLNFGVLYFLGKPSLAQTLGVDIKTAGELYDTLMKAMPFIKSTRMRVVKSAEARGYVRTFCGRIQEVGEERKNWDNGEGRPKGKFYPLFNALIQGTAADILKFSLREAYRAGIYDVLKLHILVHDETGVSIPKTREGIEAYKEQQMIMQDTVKLKVPIIADADIGTTRGTMTWEGDTCFEKALESIK